MRDFYWVSYHLPTKTKHYRVQQFETATLFLAALDGWNRIGLGEWQHHSVTPTNIRNHTRMEMD
jgi:hypothetical protein